MLTREQVVAHANTIHDGGLCAIAYDLSTTDAGLRADLATKELCIHAQAQELQHLRAEVEELTRRETGYLSELADYGTTVIALRAEVARLKERLEEDYGFDAEGKRVEAPGIPDGIECRDATIQGLDGRVKELRADLATKELCIHAQAQELSRVGAEVVRLKETNTQAVDVLVFDAAKRLDQLQQQNAGLTAQLAAMTQERDEAVKWKGHHDHQVELKRKLHENYDNTLRTLRQRDEQLAAQAARIQELLR